MYSPTAIEMVPETACAKPTSKMNQVSVTALPMAETNPTLVSNPSCIPKIASRISPSQLIRRRSRLMWSMASAVVKGRPSTAAGRSRVSAIYDALLPVSLAPRCGRHNNNLPLLPVPRRAWYPGYTYAEVALVSTPANSPAGGALFSFGLRIYRARHAVLAVWAVALLAALALAPSVARLLQPGGLSSRDLESEQAAAELRYQLGYNPATIIVVFTSDGFGVDDPRWAAAEDAALAEVRQLPDVAEVRTRRENARQVAPDGRATYATIALKSDTERFRSSLPRVRAALKPTELQMVVTGAPVFYADILEVTERDLRRAELISFPFAVLALLLVFGSVVAAAVPGAVGGAAVLCTLGVMAALARVMDLSIFALNLVTMLRLGLGIDYSLFIVSRFREELAEGAPVDQAVARASSTAGRAVLFSGLTVFVGLLGLSSFKFMALRSMGQAGSLVVLLSVAAALTLLPALLGVLGNRINAFTIRRSSTRGGFWAA